MKPSRTPLAINLLLVVAVLLLQAVLGARAADISWTNGTGSYHNALNWSPNTIPGPTDDAINDRGLGNVVQLLLGDPDWSLSQLRAGNAASGAFQQNGQTLTVTNAPRALRLGVANGATGVYTLNGGAINYTNAFTVGELGQATLNLNGGSIAGSGTLAVSIGTSLDAVNATLDTGLTKGGHTWFERGLYTADPTRGLPVAGSSFTHESLVEHSYTMPSSYAGNCVVMIGDGLTNGTITLSPATACSALSFLGSAGNGAVTINYTVHHASPGTSETGSLVVPDWYDNAATIALRVGGRVQADGLNFQNVDGAVDYPRLYSIDISLADAVNAVTSIELTYSSGGVAGLMALSGNTGAAFVPLAITGYNADAVLSTAESIYASSTITNILNQTSGTINISGECWVGNYGNGIYTFSGGTNAFQNWFVAGRSGGQGTITMTGGELNKIGNGNLLIGSGYQAPTGSSPSGVLNQSGGTINSQGEFSIPENAPATGTYNLSGTGVVNVNNWMQVGRSGGTGFMTMSSGSVTKTGGGNFIVGDNATGTLTQTGGSINISSSEAWMGQGGTGNGTYNMSGGSFACDNWISIGRNGGFAVLNLINGIFTKTGGGNFSIGGDGGATGTLNQSGGTISNSVNPGSFTYVGQGGGNGTWTMDGGLAVLGTLRLCENGSGSGMVNFNNGTIRVSEVNAGGLASTFNFNGGTLLANGDNASFFHDLGSASVQAGGAIFDSQGFNITVAQNLTDGGGGLTKNGLGTLMLTGANSYSGATAVNAGQLATTTDSTGGGNLTLANGTELSLKVQAANAQFNAGNATLATSTGATLDFVLGAFGNLGLAPFNVVGTLAVNGTITVNIADDLPQFGQFPLIKYGTRTGAGSFVLGALPVGVGASLSNNVGNGSVDLVINNVNVPRWEGLAGGNWDIGLTTNWINVGTGLPTFYLNGNQANFDDNALGATTVNLVTTVSPASVVVNNSSLSYSLTGSGKISGATGLTKQGSGTLTVANTGGNNYTGPTVISAGVLSVGNLGNAGLPSPIGAGNLVLAGGTLSYAGAPTSINRGYSSTGGGIETLSGLTLSGLAAATAGEFRKAGSAQLAYTGIGSNALSAYLVGGTTYRVADGSVLLDGSAGPQSNYVRNLRLGAADTSGTLNTALTLTNTILNVRNGFTVGDHNNATGTMVINSGSTLNHEGQGGNALDIGDNNGNPGAGVVIQNGGTVNATGELWLGQTANAVGSYGLSSGTLNLHNWLAVGRAGGSGTFTMTGGTFTKDGNGNFIIGAGPGPGSVGTFNHSAGTINCTTEYWIAEGGCIGTNNISGSAVVNIGNWASLGRGGQAVVNFSGGTITKTGGGNFIVGDNGNGYFNQTGGALTINNDLWIGQAGGGVGRFDLSAGTVTNNGWLAIGRESAQGILNISGGSMTKAGGGNISITHNSGASGTVNITGGSFTCASGETWIGENGGPAVWTMGGGTATVGYVQLARNSDATGTLNLNGGTFSATEITTGSSGTSTLNFDGGTLAAGASTVNFLHGLTSANVLGGGAVIDSGTNVVSIAQPLLDGAGAGSLTKLGTGTVYLNGANTYTGPTLVNAGTLGGTGIIAGPVTVAGGATLAPGASVGTLTVNNNVTLGGTIAMEISKDGGVATSDLLTVSGNIGFGGNLTVLLTGANGLAINDTFNLFDWGTKSGSFAVTTLPAGYYWDTTQLYVDGTIRVIGIVPPHVNPPVVSGGNLVVTGIGGPSGASYTWVSSTNVAAPVANWTTNSTGVFDASGGFSNAFPINVSERARFFRIKTP